jgi:hypothetical protein
MAQTAAREAKCNLQAHGTKGEHNPFRDGSHGKAGPPGSAWLLGLSIGRTAGKTRCASSLQHPYSRLLQYCIKQHFCHIFVRNFKFSFHRFLFEIK